MKSLFSAIDGLLRGGRTSEQALRDDASALPARLFVPAAIVLGAIYGFFMAWYAIANKGADQAAQQAFASMVKLPALFLLTLLVTFPSLYVFNALVGCRLRLASTLRLLVSAIVVNLAVAASLGPIVGFFALSTKSYPFMVVLNVVMLAVGGFIGLGFLLRMLRRLAIAGAMEDLERETSETSRPSSPPPPPPPPPPPSPPASPLNASPSSGTEASSVPDPMESARWAAMARAAARPMVDPQEARVRERLGSANLVFNIWIIIYAVVGAQMGWLLRPFIGHPDMPFSWFRPRMDNFFIGLWNNLLRMVGN